jgi:hypothetical protein
MFDKARAHLAGDSGAPMFGCPLDHSCMARLRVYPDDVLELVRVHGDDDRAILAGLQERGIPSAEELWFDARATEDELLTGVYLKVRPRERVDELKPRDGHRVLAIGGRGQDHAGRAPDADRPRRRGRAHTARVAAHDRERGRATAPHRAARLANRFDNPAAAADTERSVIRLASWPRHAWSGSTT